MVVIACKSLRRPASIHDIAGAADLASVRAAEEDGERAELRRLDELERGLLLGEQFDLRARRVDAQVARPQSTPEKRVPASPASSSVSLNSGLLTPAER